MSILQPEASIWYAICWVVVGVRFVSKRMRLGSWRALQVDDYLVVPAMVSTESSTDYYLDIILHPNKGLRP